MVGMQKLTSSPLFGAVAGALIALALYHVFKLSPILFLLVALSPLCFKKVRMSIISYWKSKKA